MGCVGAETGRGNTVGDPTATAVALYTRQMRVLQTQVARLAANVQALEQATLPVTLVLDHLHVNIRAAALAYFGTDEPSLRDVGQQLCIDESVVRERLEEAERAAAAVMHGHARWYSKRRRAREGEGKSTPQQPRENPAVSPLF